MIPMKLHTIYLVIMVLCWKKEINVSWEVKRQEEISKSPKNFIIYHQNDNPTLMSPHILKTYPLYNNPLSPHTVYKPTEHTDISYEKSEPAEYICTS